MTQTPAPYVPEPATAARKVLFVAGAGRSGTSTLAGIASLLGLQVPQPEVEADETNPKGFSEPRWTVEWHDRWLDEVVVQVGDARPQAWVETARVSAREPARERVATWLRGHLAEHPELVVKDPRLGWFLGLWREGAVRAGAEPLFATMLRPPAEVVGSRQKYYQNRLGPAHLAAGWVNMLLHTELGTRPVEGQRGVRAFVRYADLLGAAEPTTRAMAEQLGLETLVHASAQRWERVHDFVDPSLRRVTVTLDELGLPRRLEEIVEQTWEQLNLLVDPARDTAQVHGVLDELRAAYTELYAESEAIARSTAIHRGLVEARRVRAEQQAGPEAASEAVPQTAPKGRRRVWRSGRS